MVGRVYALNLFNVADRDEYLAYSRRSATEVVFLFHMSSEHDFELALVLADIHGRG